MKRIFGAVTVLAGLSAFGSAQQIATRTQLNAILAGAKYSYTDSFEAYNIADGNANTLGVSELDSTSTVNGQGPGLVDPGVHYVDAGGGLLQWNGANYFGSPSEEILADGGTRTLSLDYTKNVDVMGVDLRQYTGFGDTFTANVYSGSTLVGTYHGTLANSGTSQFFGWFSATGITEVDLIGGTNGWSPIIDNHSYGYTAAPEPASMAALALGGLALLRRRRAR